MGQLARILPSRFRGTHFRLGVDWPGDRGEQVDAGEGNFGGALVPAGCFQEERDEVLEDAYLREDMRYDAIWIVATLTPETAEVAQAACRRDEVGQRE